jgi:hypothetical protein
MADINTENLKEMAQDALEGASKAAAEAVEAARPVVDAAVKGVQDAAKAAEPTVSAAAARAQEAFDTHARPAIDAAGKKAQEALDAAKPIVDGATAKAAEMAKQAGLDKTLETVSHDAGVVVDAAKGKLEEVLNKDLDGDGKIGKGE